MAIRFDAEADFSALERENRKLQADLVRSTEKFDKLANSGAKFQQKGDRAFKTLQQSSDRLKTRMAFLADEMKAGRIIASQYDTEMAELGEEAARTDDKFKQLTAEVADLDGQLKRGVITQDQYKAAVRKSGEQVTKSGEKMIYNAEVVKKSKTGMDKLKGQVMALGAGYMSFQAVLGLTGKAMAYVRGEIDKAKASQDRLVDSRRALTQVATSKEDLAQMIGRADAAAKEYGVDRQQAYQVMFAARSEGFEGDYEGILRNAPVIDPTKAAGVAGQIPGLFKNVEKVTSGEAISGTLLAAQASRLNFEEIARAMPQAAEGGALAGASFGETTGMLSVLAGRFKSGETAADRIKALGAKLGTSEQFGGKGLVGGFEALTGADEETRSKFLGDSQELNAVFQILAEELPAVKERIQMVNAELATMRGGGTSLMDRQRGIAMSDTGEQARIDRNRAAIAREQANERQLAERGNRTQAAIDSELAAMKDEGVSPLTQWASNVSGNIAELIGADENQTRGATSGMRRAIDEQIEGIQPAINFSATVPGGQGIGALSTIFNVARHSFTGAEQNPQAAGSEQTELMRRTADGIDRQTGAIERQNDLLRNQPRHGTSAAAAGVQGTHKLPR